MDREKIDFKDFSSNFAFSDLEKFESFQYFICVFYMVNSTVYRYRLVVNPAFGKLTLQHSQIANAQDTNIFNS